MTWTTGADESPEEPWTAGRVVRTVFAHLSGPFLNLPGLAILAVALSVSLASLLLVPSLNGGMAIHYMFGALIFGLDIWYRHERVRPRLEAKPPLDTAVSWNIDLSRIWLISYEGGTLLLLPAWLVGLLYVPVLLWLAYGGQSR